jgi:hypothetical protein
MTSSLTLAAPFASYAQNTAVSQMAREACGAGRPALLSVMPRCRGCARRTAPDPQYRSSAATGSVLLRMMFIASNPAGCRLAAEPRAVVPRSGEWNQRDSVPAAKLQSSLKGAPCVYTALSPIQAQKLAASADIAFVENTSSTAARNNSATLHACATHPPGRFGLPASATSETCPSPAVCRCSSNPASHSAALARAASEPPFTRTYAVINGPISQGQTVP